MMGKISEIFIQGNNFLPWIRIALILQFCTYTTIRKKMGGAFPQQGPAPSSYGSATLGYRL